MARKDNDNHILTPDELPEALKAGFASRYRMDRTIEDLKAQHIDPVAKERTTLMRGLKKSTDINSKDLDLLYKLYERGRLAAEMEDAETGEKIQKDLRRAFKALNAGETLDFLNVIDSEDDAHMFEDADGPDDNDDLAPVGADIESDGMAGDSPNGPSEPRAERQPIADYGDSHDDAAIGDTEGVVAFFNEGEAAGLAGQSPTENPHTPKTAAHKAWAKGWVSGSGKKREQEETASETEPKSMTAA